MKNLLKALALTTAFGVGLTAVPYLAASPAPRAAFQDHDRDHEEHPEYRTNRYYRLGNTEGYHDYRGHVTRDADHHHKYRNDTDRAAHDYGYQQGLNGTYYRRPH